MKYFSFKQMPVLSRLIFLSVRAMMLWMLAVLFCAGHLYALVDEDMDRGAEITERMMATPEAQQKYEVFLKDVLSHTPRPTIPTEKYFIKHVEVMGADILPRKELKKITDDYRNRELTAEDITKCIDRISALCRQEGYVTSYADFGWVSDAGVLNIAIARGKIGAIRIEGNQHYSEKALLGHLGIDAGEDFNLKKLQAGVFKTGRHMDRKAKMHINYDDDKGLGNTDVTIEVKDRAPTHLTLEVDNYGSYFINQTRYRIVTLHNNITGNDDALQIKMQWAGKSSHELFDMIYRLPLTRKLWWEYYLMPYKAEDYFHGLEGVHKRAWKTYTYLHYNFVEEPGKLIVGDIGWVHKIIDWEQPLGTPQAKDHFSALLFGFDLDFTDSKGRTIVANDFEMGIPGLFGATGDGGMEERTSVLGADGGYNRNHLVVARRHKLFEGTDWLFKSHWQWADAIMTGVNSFSVGGYFGVIDMRGYPRAQTYGENGISFSTGLACAPYFLPKTMKVPGSKATFYKSTQLFALIDWAQVDKMIPDGFTLEQALAAEIEPREFEAGKTSTTLSSFVAGVQMMLPEMFFLRLEAGIPLSSTDTADGKDYHIWFRVSKTF